MSAKSYYSSNSDVSDVVEKTYCIFLHISDGIGLTAKEPIGDQKEINISHVMVKASLNGVQFEVEGHSNASGTKFNSNCIWECKITDIKRMKTDNRPIKLECYSKYHHSGLIVCDKLIGTLLLPIKCIPLSTKLTYGAPNMKYYKLGTLGTEWRYSKPELSLLLMIVKKSIIERGQMELYIQRHHFPKSTSPKLSQTAFMLRSQKNCYVQLLEQDGLIQVGNDPIMDTETYRITLTFKHVKNIESLLNRNAQMPMGNTFVFTYDLLGQVSTRDIWINHGCGNCYAINEKISVNFKSSFTSLRKYFENIFSIPIFIYSNGITVAKDNFDVTKMLPDNDFFQHNNINNTWTTNGDWFFECLYPGGDENSARLFVDYVFCIQRVLERNTLHNDNCLPLEGNKMLPLEGNYCVMQDTESKMSEKALTPSGRTFKSENLGMDIIKNKEESLFCCAATNTDPTDIIDYEELSYKVVQELEQWKSQQMQKFITELARKEKQFEAEWHKNNSDSLEHLEKKMETCDQLNTQLKIMIRDFSASTVKTQEHLRLFDVAKREIETNYEKKFIEIGYKMECLKSEIKEKDKLTSFDNATIQQIKDDNDKLKVESLELREHIKGLEMQLAISQKANVPTQQLINIISDLGKQSERLKQTEKTNHFYQEQWADITLEINKIKFDLINLQGNGKKSKSKDERSNDLSLLLNDMVNEEQDALSTERSELNSLRNVLYNAIDTETEGEWD